MKKIFYVLFLFNCIITTAQTQDDIKLLTQFGINPHDTNIDIEHSIESITSDLKKLVNIGAKSLVFKRWNNMLMYYKSNDYNNYVLVSPDGSAFEPPTNRGELSQYDVINGRNYGLMYNNKDIVIYVPSRSAPLTTIIEDKQSDIDKCKLCRKALVEYLSAVIRYQTHQDNRDNPMINSSNNKNFLRYCYGSGQYDNINIDSEELPSINRDNKLIKYYKRGIKIKDILLLLSGRDKNALPAGQNPYLPLTL